MITLEGEVTELACPPNRAEQWRCVTIWLPEAEEHVEFTCSLEEIKKADFQEGDILTVKIDKKHGSGTSAQNFISID